MNATTQVDRQVRAGMAAHIGAVLEVTTMWLGLAQAPAVRELPALVAVDVLQGLLQGDAVRWQGWTVRATPSRRIRAADGSDEWTPGVAALCAQGYVSGLRLDEPSAQQVCERILAIESRIAADRLIARLERQQPEPEFEDY